MDIKQNLKPVPDSEEADAGEFFLEGEVDGGKVSFFFDTGATFTSVVGLESLASYPKIRATQFKGVGDTLRSADVIAVKRLQVAGHTFQQVEVVRAQADTGLKSTIGIDLIKAHAIDFNAKINILSFGHVLRAKGLVFNLGKKGHIYLPVQYSTNTPGVLGVWDTGAGLTLVDLADVKSNPTNFTFLKNSTGGDTTGASVTLPFYKAKLLKVGSLEFHDLKVLATDLSNIRGAIGDNVRVAIGYNVIIGHDWSFDMKNRRWSVE